MKHHKNIILWKSHSLEKCRAELTQTQLDLYSNLLESTMKKFNHLNDPLSHFHLWWVWIFWTFQYIQKKSSYLNIYSASISDTSGCLWSYNSYASNTRRWTTVMLVRQSRLLSMQLKFFLWINLLFLALQKSQGLMKCLYQTEEKCESCRPSTQNMGLVAAGIANILVEPSQPKPSWKNQQI